MNRGLTRQEAEDGVQPEKLTKDEWKAMHKASLKCEYDAVVRTWASLRNRVWQALGD